MEIKTWKTDNWSDIPDVWKQTKKVKEVTYKADPKDAGLSSILGEFVSTDDLRPAMTGMYFDKENIVSTDAHRLFIVPNTGNVEGIYEPTTGKKIDAKFPDYRVVIPKGYDLNFKVNINKLKTYLTAVINGKYMNMSTYQIVLRYTDQNKNKEYIAVNGQFFIDLLEAFEKFGNSEVWVGISSPTKAILVAEKESYVENPALAFGKSPFGLCMPIMLSGDFQYYAGDRDYGRELYVGYDLSSDEIINSNSSPVSDWQPKSDWGLPYWTPEESKVATFLTKNKRSKTLPILEYVKVYNKVALCTDLATFYQINNFDVQDGLYLIINSALVNPPEFSDNYPSLPDREFGRKHEFQFLGAVDYATSFVSDDDLRPAMTGVHYKIEDGRVFIESTDAYTGFRMTDQYSKSAYPDIDVIIENPADVVKTLKTFESISCEVSKNNTHLKFTCPRHVVYCRTIDARFPDIKVVLPSAFEEAVLLNGQEINKTIASVKGKDKKGKLVIDIEDRKTIVNIDTADFSDTEEIKKIGEVKSLKVRVSIEESKSLLTGSYILSASKSEFKLKNPYNSLKNYLKVASEICSNNADFDIKIMLNNRIAASEINKTFLELNRIVLKTDEGGQKKTKTSSSKINKKQELEKAIKGLEILAKKGNKIAENTLKGLKILLKRM